MHRKSPPGPKGRGCHPIIGDLKPPTGLCAGIHLGKNMRMHVAEGPRTGEVWKRNEMIGPR